MYRDFHFLMIFRFPGDRASRLREGTFPRPLLAELDFGVPSFTGDAKGCCVGQQWRGRAPWGVGWRSGEPVSRGECKTENVWKLLNEMVMMTTTEA